MILFFVTLVISLGIGCDSGGGDIIIDRPDDDNPDENPVGSGMDPGKRAEACYPAFADDELNVVTWNIREFPNSSTTVSKVRAIVENLDADIIAVQEIDDPDQFLSLEEQIDGWKAVYADVRFGLELGYLYKIEAFVEFSELTNLTIGDSYAFPREPVVVSATHASGLEITFINIHLKCCGTAGSEDFDRRLQASLELKDYIDDNLASQAVIVLGDWNDDLFESNSPFANFENDQTNYLFADQSIAKGPNTNWSYPSWPSHLDHILITDELFDNLGEVMTIIPNDCITDYSGTVSDHRPVLASFSR